MTELLRSPLSSIRVLALFLLLAMTGAGLAQSYPTKPVRIVVPFAPGGGTDMIARVIGPLLAERLAQSVLIDNRPGASTIVGSEIVANSKGDGYTLLLALTGTLAINPSLYKALSYNPITSFSPISLVAESPNILVVHPTIPAKSVRQLVDIARARPGALSFASSGRGGAPHLAGELFMHLAKIDMVHVPYKGAAPALADVLGGHVFIMFSALPPVLSMAKTGRLRALAVTTAKRSQLVPNLPTMAESGIVGFEVTTWFGLLAPAFTDKVIIEKLNKELRAVLGSSDVRRKFADQGLDVRESSAIEFSDYIKREIVRWARIVRDSGLRPE